MALKNKKQVGLSMEQDMIDAVMRICRREYKRKTEVIRELVRIGLEHYDEKEVA